MVKAAVCKTAIHRSESGRRLQFFCRDGGIGRRSGLKIRRSNPCGFESLSRHQLLLRSDDRELYLSTIRITYFVHSPTTDSERGLATGWSPGELSVKGIKQAGELGSLISRKQFDAVFCSDLKRAADTAESYSAVNTR